MNREDHPLQRKKPGSYRAFFPLPVFSNVLEAAFALSLAVHGSLAWWLHLQQPAKQATHQVAASAAAITVHLLAGSDTENPDEVAIEAIVKPAVISDSRIEDELPDTVAEYRLPEDETYYPRQALTIPAVLQQPLLLPPPDPGVSGRAIIRIFVSRAGTVDRLEIEESDVEPVLLLPVLEEIAASRYFPGKLEGKEVKSLIRLEILLEGGNGE